jgi:hypothetical protein
VTPFVAVTALELGRYPVFEKLTIRLLPSVPLRVNVPLGSVIALLEPTETATPERTLPVESVTTPAMPPAEGAVPPLSCWPPVPESPDSWEDDDLLLHAPAAAITPSATTPTAALRTFRDLD